MKRINLTIDDETAKVLAGKVNKSEFIREAILIHNDAVSTDTISAIKDYFTKTLKQQKETQERLIELYEKVESVERTIEELSGR